MRSCVENGDVLGGTPLLTIDVMTYIAVRLFDIGNIYLNSDTDGRVYFIVGK